MMLRKLRLGSLKIANAGSLNNLTLGGKVLVCALLFCLHGAISLESPLIQLFAALLGLLIVTLGVGYLFRPRLHILANAPSSVACDETLELTVTLRHSRRRAFDLLVDLDGKPASWEVDPRPARVESLRPGEQVVVPLTARPTRRGAFALPPIRVTSTFPLNLFRFRHRVAPAGQVIVTPSYRPIALFDILQRLGGSHAEQLTGTRAGGSEDYLGNREYLPGIAVRRWDYCSWARLGRPVVREYQNEGQVTATLVVDTYQHVVPREDVQQPKFEALLSLAAAVSDALARDACRVNTLIVGPEVVSPPGLSLLDQHEAILETLATARPAPAEALADLLDNLATWQSQPNLVFVLLNGWTDHGRQLCLALEQPGSHVCRLVVNGGSAKLPSDVRSISPDQIAKGEVEIS